MTMETLMPVLRQGTWGREKWPGDEDIPDVDASLKAAGWSCSDRMGDEFAAHVMIWTCAVPKRDLQFLLDVSIDGDGGALMGASDMVDLGTLLSTWLPIVRDAMIVGLIDEFTEHEFTELNAISKIAALAAYGIEEASAWEQGARERRAENRRRLRMAAEQRLADSTGGSGGSR